MIEGEEARRTVNFSEGAVAAFANLTNDYAPVHFDATVAKEMGFRGRIVHGFLISSIYSELLGCRMPGPNSIIQKLSIDLLAPVYVGENAHFSVKVTRFSEAMKAVSLTLSATNDDGELVSRGSAVCILRK